MEFLPSKKLRHVDGLSRLIPKFLVPLEDTKIAALKAEKEVKYVVQYSKGIAGEFRWNKRKS